MNHHAAQVGEHVPGRWWAARAQERFGLSEPRGFEGPSGTRRRKTSMRAVKQQRTKDGAYRLSRSYDPNQWLAGQDVDGRRRREAAGLAGSGEEKPPGWWRVVVEGQSAVLKRSPCSWGRHINLLAARTQRRPTIGTRFLNTAKPKSLPVSARNDSIRTLRVGRKAESASSGDVVGESRLSHGQGRLGRHPGSERCCALGVQLACRDDSFLAENALAHEAEVVDLWRQRGCGATARFMGSTSSVQRRWINDTH